MENIGSKIYKLRIEKGVSQEELAEALAVARPTISRWENETVTPSMENIQKLCSFFNVGINRFLDEEEIAIVKENTEEQSVAEPVKKETKLKTLKIVSVVVGMVLLALCVIACGIAVYVSTIPTLGGAWSNTVYRVNYVSIICIVVGILAFALFVTLAVIFTKNYIKNRKNK